MPATIPRPPFRRRLAALGGLLFGAALPLVLMVLVAALWNGGLSDAPRAAPPAYVIE